MFRSVSVSVVVVILVFFSTAAAADGGSSGECSVETLQGTYAIQLSGFAGSDPTLGLPFLVGDSIPIHVLNISIFDGEGALETHFGTDALGGLIEQGALTSGTYTVNEDCSGSLNILVCHAPEFGGPHVHNIDIVVQPNGRKFFLIIADLGANGAGSGKLLYDDHELSNEGEPFCEAPE